MQTIGKRSVASFLTVLLNIGWWGVALALALASCILVFVSLTKSPDDLQMSIPVSFSVDARTPVSAPSLGIESAQIRKATGTLRFPTHKGAFLAANIALLVLLLAVALVIISQLRALFRTIRDGRPFVPANAARLRWVGIAVIVGELARSTVVFFENQYAMTHFVAEGLRFDTRPDLNLLAIVHGLIILVIAEVFRAGTRLDEDQSLTV
jgi:hypothetical protein